MSQKLDEKLSPLRHTAEHVLHTAMQNLYPELKKAMGPATPDGFYFDFDLEDKISEEDFPKIEKEMQKLIDADLPMVQENIDANKAREIFKDNPYKLEWIKDIEERGEEISTYKMGDQDLDICIGPHAKSTGEVKAFKLLSVAGAYWRGSEKNMQSISSNKMLTRIYGTAFPSQKELEDYLNLQEEAKLRDHRIIGEKLGLFVFSDLVGKGLPLFTEKGATIRRELERFIVDEELKRNYQHVYTPDLAKVDLYKKSGHYPYYKDSMYPSMKTDEDELILRPMTCPHHFQLYLSKPRSYKELPVRYAELAKQFRYEKSGELTGLMRVRSFCLADAHIICRPDQAIDEIYQVLDLIEYAASIFGLVKGKDFRYRLSLGDRSNKVKYYEDNKAWDFAEDVLRQVLIKREAPYFEAEGEAAFYGPKIDIQMKNVAGKEDTAFTVQYDFVMPKRFELAYTDSDNTPKEAVVIHRSSIGAIERVMAFLIEKYAGAFPVWLSPVQVQIIPIASRHYDYANGIALKLKDQDIRVKIAPEEGTMQGKIRDAEMQKIPYMLVVGDREIQNNSVSVRTRGQKELGAMDFDKFLSKVKSEIENKSQV